MLTITNVKKTFNKGTVNEKKALNGINLHLAPGDFVTIIGGNGAGKSTMLNMIAGVYPIDSGKIEIDGVNISREPEYKRAKYIGRVFQDPMRGTAANMEIQENLAMALRRGKSRGLGWGIKKNEKDFYREALAQLDLGLQTRMTSKVGLLSGGQRQRVALARAVVKRADYFLLDEPLSNLDAQLRMRARKELVKIHEMYHPTLVYVTHDQIEAMTVGDRIALMYRGKMEMLDTPSHVYNRPASVFCAKFIGSPSMNIVEAEYHNGALVIGKQKVELPGIWQRIAAQCPSGLLYAGVRPEHVMMSRTPQERSIEGVVRYVEDYGNRYGVYIQVEGDKNELIAIREGEIPQPGEKVYIHVETEKLHLFDRGTEKSLGYPEMVIRAQEKLAVPKLEKAIAQ